MAEATAVVPVTREHVLAAIGIALLLVERCDEMYKQAAEVACNLAISHAPDDNAVSYPLQAAAEWNSADFDGPEILLKIAREKLARDAPGAPRASGTEVP